MKTLTILTISLFLGLCANLLAGGGEGTAVGGSNKAILELMMEKEKSNDLYLDIPSIPINGKQVPVHHLCYDGQILRTYGVHDNYPSYIDVYQIDQNLKTSNDHFNYHRYHRISLYRNIDLNHTGMTVHAQSRLKSINYIIPNCSVSR